MKRREFVTLAQCSNGHQPVPASPVRIKPPDPQEIAQEIAVSGVVKLADLLAEESGEHHHDHDDHEHIDESGTVQVPVRELGGRRDGLDPTRYGDWEKNGRCIDF